MFRLHYSPGFGSMAPHMVLREAGAPFELVPVDLSKGEHQSDAFRRLNPLARIPVLEADGLVLYEAPAICLHLADALPAAQLAPPPGTPDRALLYRWLMYLTNTLQAHMLCYYYPHRICATDAAAAEVKAAAEQRIAEDLDYVAAEIARAAGPWLCGQAYTVADPYLLMLCSWTLGMERPARAVPLLASLLDRVAARPAVRAALEAEGLPEPWF
ncbi:MAG: glutathione S-transferase family protein [Betaproteobacteria bacterium]|jgi:glutathione S-transferase|nr:glutathione S-transferase N-terminal domain-containing protein [Rhodocyclaceae bacterium]MCA3133710.1 glutathione S-transferase N-terminal domain-containing protein [Rhodocyclaceae bacterium]MCA3143031.1 glutathione S-transferase N-terminal domain-containing protein [Rhodocyclaceae bacterium]MCA3144138.1 glutathione S-transferase N-terminal domain-containing protein [Rhodocyclaceae bacterium]MCE2898221.1 glutathione S-transferase N-terminal domain-containing protein [Betaproteobacteria bacte